LLRHLERIDTIRSHGLGLAPSIDLPAAPLGRLARNARTTKPASLAALHEPRRTATLAALFQHWKLRRSTTRSSCSTRWPPTS